MKHLAILVACLAVAACAPAYIEELDKAAGLTRQMTLVGTVGPVSLGDVTGVRYLPAKPTAASLGLVNAQAGFLVVDAGANEFLSYVYVDANGNTQYSGSGSQVFPLSGQSSYYPLYHYKVTNTLNNQASIIVFKYDPTTIANNQYEQFVAALPSGPMTFPTYQTGWLTLTNAVSNGWSPIGGSLIPAPPPGPETYAALLGTGTGSAAVGANTTNIPTSVFSSTTGQAVLASVPALSTYVGSLTRSYFYYDPATNVGFASYYQAGQWNCLRWDGTTATPMTGITNRVDGMLSSGDLLSTQGGTLHIYDATGTGSSVVSVSLNGLRLCYEAYVGSTPYVFFSLPMKVRHGEWVFTVYAVPTSSMRSLGG